MRRRAVLLLHGDRLAERGSRRSPVPFPAFSSNYALPAVGHPQCRREEEVPVHCLAEESREQSGSCRLHVRVGAAFRRRMVLRHLAGLRGGVLRLVEPSGERHELGVPADDGLHAELHVGNPAFFDDLFRGGELGLAESRMQGHWSSPDLTAVLQLFCRNLEATRRSKTITAALTRLIHRGRHWLARNTPRGSRRNIAAHYDLGNEFFALFLDSSMMYSSALFYDNQVSLEQAAHFKLDRICRRLDLQPGDHVVEIGTGWGGFALHAARRYGCKVTTTTISDQQYELAGERIRRAGLTDQITLLKQDYRELTGIYDRLVSIEMIEAVGHRYLPDYFQTCDRLLRRGGRMLLQAITIPDERYESYRHSVDFIRRYIFPGGHLPSVEAMRQAASQTELRLTQEEQFPGSYARTLREWRNRFLSRLDDVRSMGFDERFIRMWEYYLCYSEAAFLERVVGVGHYLWQKPTWQPKGGTDAAAA